MELRDQRCVVVGLGESGLAMAKWLFRQGARVVVIDSREHPPGRATLTAAVPEIEVVSGPFSEKSFADADMIALSPGVPKSTPVIAEAARKIPLVSEADLFADALPVFAPESRVLAITGSNGKSTTTTLTAHLLNGAGIAATACGNLSPSLLNALINALDTGRLPKVWVLELSSFQLETTHRLNADAATVLNVTEDHLDRYEGRLADYAEAKARIFQGFPQRVVNRDDDWSLSMGGCGSMVTFGLDAAPRAGHYGIRKNAIWLGAQRLAGLDELPFRSAHNAANVMAALALCRAIGVSAEAVLPSLGSFRGLPHRVEQVAEINGVLYVDDSKGTNVGATLAAIRGMGRPVAIVLGGDGKGQDFSPLKNALKTQGRAAALLGRDARNIAAALDGCDLPLAFCEDMASAVRWLSGQARPGDCVLLSPACASWDQYANYVERAAAFVAAVESLKGEEGAS